jgi:hypothetical protein
MPIYQYYDKNNGEMVEMFREVARRDEVPPNYIRVRIPRSLAIFGTSSAPIDPTSAEGSVPRAFRQLEQKTSAREIARESGFSVDEIKRVWSI